jgi:hypothetical protein
MEWVENKWTEYIQPGKPTARLHMRGGTTAATCWFEWLSYMAIFETTEEAQNKQLEWLWTYNNERPNMMGIGGSHHEMSGKRPPVKAHEKRTKTPTTFLSR